MCKLHITNQLGSNNLFSIELYIYIYIYTTYDSVCARDHLRAVEDMLAKYASNDACTIAVARKTDASMNAYLHINLSVALN